MANADNGKRFESLPSTGIIRLRASLGTDLEICFLWIRTAVNPWHSHGLLRDLVFLLKPSEAMAEATLTTCPTNLSPLSIEPYRELPNCELEERIRFVKERLSESLLILGHHYQQDEVIQFADLRGDSFKLSQLAAQSDTCRWIVFCGVHFMAETADILSRDEVEVYLPDMAAGCSMADMADIAAVESAWADLGEIVDTEDLMPVTYVNSSADVKAFCGRRGGIVCTSSNARAVLEWSLGRRQRVFFFPDQHLGRNTGRLMGIPLKEMSVWDWRLPQGGNRPEVIRSSRILLWKGHCSVHQMFKPEHVEQFRRRFPAGRVLVHPECMMPVVDQADLVGSTEFIIKTIAEAEAGSTWGVGTELHLVNRLAQEHPDKRVLFLSPMVCMCATMFRIDLPHLSWCLDNLARGTPVNRIRVPQDTAHWARLALRRMLEIR
jgi:quinolinate synthase